MSHEHDLNRSWKKLQHAERLLLDYYDTKFAPGEVAGTSPVLSPSNARGTPKSRGKPSYYGGILNNRNDPSKRSGRGKEYGSPGNLFATKTFDFTSTAVRAQDSSSELCGSPLFKTYEKPSSSASTITRRPLHHKSAFTGEARPEPFDCDFTDLILAPKRVKLKNRRTVTRPGTISKGKRWNGHSSKTTKAVETDSPGDDRIDWVMAPQSPTEPRIGSPFTIQRCTPASLFLDHLVREQAYRRYIKKPVRSVVRIPHVRSPLASFRNTEIQRNLEENSAAVKTFVVTKRKSVGTEALHTAAD